MVEKKMLKKLRRLQLRICKAEKPRKTREMISDILRPVPFSHWRGIKKVDFLSDGECKKMGWGENRNATYDDSDKTIRIRASFWKGSDDAGRSKMFLKQVGCHVWDNVLTDAERGEFKRIVEGR